MNKIFLKRLKRKRKLAGRVECHGNKFSCFSEHLKRKELTVSPAQPILHSSESFFREQKKANFWHRFFNWLKKLWI